MQVNNDLTKTMSLNDMYCPKAAINQIKVDHQSLNWFYLVIKIGARYAHRPEGTIAC